MLLKVPISNTKRFFHRTLQTVKSIFSPTIGNSYQKIPKSPLPPPMDHITKESPPHDNSGTRIGDHNNINADCSTKGTTPCGKYKIKKSDEEEGKQSWSREEKSWWVARKLKELEMIDTSDVDHVLDIEQILHYYSRLSCPEYLDIVDKFFMDVYSEFFSSSNSPVIHSTSKSSSRLLLMP